MTFSFPICAKPSPPGAYCECDRRRQWIMAENDIRFVKVKQARIPRFTDRTTLGDQRTFGRSPHARPPGEFFCAA